MTDKLYGLSYCAFGFAVLLLLILAGCGDDKKPAPPPAPTSYKLTVVFACDPEDGCGEPPFIMFSETYTTKAACDAAGAKWLEPNANPTGALASFACG